ncbi:MAG: hypothetical protein COZ06_11245 [Armatimonadetes bacterium CG_4_10_14_3_um_filter_66_18]|nr:molybdopterin molybdotransferase MoeA [Armatimonadota bacterium]OIO92660.1 MAG: hypothetical protein AUJ96_31845 [Armatimonadetes bacterium CG2_30_66_41]PIU90925.1 MAG: hypothetical protein COS65_23660 [Armatimonadetes bacterium CG06_land_8_20_14_3_00_66_21]PIX37386.1 MAG: hypothetical protein COZ57_34560 [Armatimonadetes bacterium CG_4_8_14_3_um_filter_66_20]PIY50083.1 MAG: hypothetical protein COZ06_11245 [Armatimonadetes bacterium CG_4_10_14_3_um_filter_66_18]PIZ48579.1 MAG: hypothetical
MLQPQHALQAVLEHVSVLADRPRSPAPECLAGHGVLGERVCVDHDMPQAALSRMDGYAVIGPLAAGTRLEIVGETPAGSPSAQPVSEGQCVRVFTGAVLPPAANAVVEQEAVTRCSDTSCVQLQRPVALGDYVTQRGAVARAGAEVLPAGAPLGPVQVSLAAAAGCAPVARPVPRIAIVATGRELVPYGARPLPHQTRDSNGPALSAAILSIGCHVAGTSHATDQLPETAAILDASLHDEAVDAVVTIGGVSVGDYDLVPQALESLGARVLLHKVAVKPGKPFLFALSRDGKPIFGLPGNPLSVLASFFGFVAPALRKMAGRPEPWAPTFPVRLTTAAPGDRDRHHWVLARVSQDEDGQWLAEPLVAAHSADVASAALADGVVQVPAGLTEVPAGQVVSFRPWRPLW